MRCSLGLLLAAGLVATGPGCATVLAQKTKTISVQSNPPGATVFLDGNPVGVTPGAVQVLNKSTHQIRFQLAGHQDGGCTLTSTVGAGWVILDVLFLLALVPIIVDAVTGDWGSVDQVECVRTLLPAPGAMPPPAAPPPSAAPPVSPIG